MLFGTLGQLASLTPFAPLALAATLVAVNQLPGWTQADTELAGPSLGGGLVLTLLFGLVWSG